MREFLSLLAVVAAQSVPCLAQSVPEGIHSDGDGTFYVCGLKATTVVDLESQLTRASDVQSLDNTPEYQADALNQSRRVLTFTKPSNRAHPAVACRHIVPAADGGSSINTEISCFSERDNWDWLYSAFEALTARTLAGVGNRGE